jgi:hypothetical protein
LAPAAEGERQQHLPGEGWQVPAWLLERRFPEKGGDGC